MPAGNLTRNFSLVAPRRKSVPVPYAVVALLYVVVGALICWQGNAILGERQHAPDLYKGGCQCAIMWCYIFHPSDFKNISDVIAYLRDLRTGIPPLLSVLEIGIFHAFGNLDLVGKHLYRLAIVSSYVLAFFIAARNRALGILSIVSGLIFMRATVVIHKGNPVVYDVFFPFFLLMFVTLYRRAGSATGSRALLAAVSAGFFLSMLELTRPFVLYLLPVSIAGAFFWLWPLGRNVFLGFLIPLLLLSGGWHAKLLWFNDGQISWSNNSGFNLHSAWSHCPVPARPPLYGLAPPIAPGRWPNLNTRERFFRSQELERAVLRCILSDPVGSAKHAFRLFRVFLAPQTWLHWNYPRDWILTPYRLGVWLSAAWLGVNLLVLFAYLGRAGRVQCIGHPENSLLLLTAGSLLMLALGNGIEQSRLLISLLPCLAAFPLPRLHG
jgi:hypothetical protein